MRRVRWAQAWPAVSQNRRLSYSPTDALINLKVRCRLRHQIPIGLNVHSLILLRVVVIPQRWSARRGYVWWRAQQREHLVDARYQHRLQVVRLRAPGWCYRFRCVWDRVARRHHPRHAYARAGLRRLSRGLLMCCHASEQRFPRYLNASMPLVGLPSPAIAVKRLGFDFVLARRAYQCPDARRVGDDAVQCGAGQLAKCAGLDARSDGFGHCLIVSV